MLLNDTPLNLPILQKEELETRFRYSKPTVKFNVLLLGVGGTGGYVMRSLVRMMHSYNAIGKSNIRLTICDGDSVEEKNLLRQDFIEPDIHKKKVDVLAHRFSHAYGLNIAKRDTYVEDHAALDALSEMPNEFRDTGDPTFLVVVGCVDNNATRQLLDEYFIKEDSIIYIDAGNDSVIVPNKPVEELTPEEKEEIELSGFTGQVVVGFKDKGRLILPPVGHMYPDMMNDNESFFPSQSCGRVVVDYPQRRMTNEVSAMVVTSYLNNLFSEWSFASHQTTFDARTMNTRPYFITEPYMKYLAEDKTSLHKYMQQDKRYRNA